MSHPICPLGLALMVLGLSCGSPATPIDDAGAGDAALLPFDAGRVDGATGDSQVADRSGADLGAPDRAVLDQSAADLSVPDHAVRDHSAPDLQLPDTSVASDTGGCTPVAPPEPVSGSPLAGESSPGRFESVTAGQFHDEYLYSSDDYTKIGVRREWGGAVIFFGLGDGSPGSNSSNTIDANDTGREVQVAFYDPDRAAQSCAYNASCASTASACERSIQFLGWNPVQGGNRCNRGSGVDSVETNGDTLVVEATPLHWNPNWDRADCSTEACDDPLLRDRRAEIVVRQAARFINQHVVELSYTLTNTDAMSHAPTAQEMPTVYTANGREGPDLWRLFTSEGTEIAIDQPANDGFFWKPFDSPGGWVTMQNTALSYGVGMYYENRLTSYQGWQLRELPFNNFRARFVFGIPGYGTVRARAYLILGSQGTVTAEAAWLDQNLAPFGVIDAPTDDAVVSGTQTVRGWALDNKGVTGIELWIDGARATSLGYGSARPDVCLVWPQYPGCNAVGYSGSYDLSGLSACQHLIEVKASDGDGNVRVIARKRVTVAH